MITRACCCGALLGLLGCQFASGLSDLHGQSRPEQASSLQQPCSKDVDCKSPKPRCLNDTCVEDEVAEQWICKNPGHLTPQSVHYAFRVVDFLTRMPPKHVEAKACRSNDVACESPVDTYKDEAATGYPQFQLPTGFLGYFEIKSELLPTLLYVTKPIVESSENRDVPLLSAETFQLTASLADVGVVPDTGLVLIDAVDCAKTPAGGIEFKIHDVDAQRVYLVDMVPNRNVQVTEYDPVNNSADAVFIGVAQGFVTFSAHLGVDGLQLQSFNAMVRANWVTFIDMMFE